MTTVFISLGSTCAPADALRRIGVRNEAYPFDWLRTSVVNVVQCIQTKFSQFLRSPRVCGNFIVDAYGFQFSHDFKTVNLEKYQETPIYPEAAIASDWENWLPAIEEKYERRIQRFHTTLADSKVVFVLEDTVDDALLSDLHDTCVSLYNNKDIYCMVINSHHSSLDYVLSGYIGDTWADMTVWQSLVEQAKLKFSL